MIVALHIVKLKICTKPQLVNSFIQALYLLYVIVNTNVNICQYSKEKVLLKECIILCTDSNSCF